VVAHFSKGVFVVVVTTANDSCIAPIQGRIECSLVGFGKRQTSERPLIFSVRNSSWRGSSPFSFPEILYAHLAPKKHAAPPSLVTSLEILTTTGMSVEK